MPPNSPPRIGRGGNDHNEVLSSELRRRNSFVSTVTNPLRHAYRDRVSKPIKKLQTRIGINDHNKVLSNELKRSHHEAMARQSLNNDFHENRHETKTFKK